MKLLSCVLIALTASLATAAPAQRLLKVSDNKHFLVTGGGDPFFWLGDTAWELDGPDNDYWDHVDYIADWANALGLTIGFLPTWGDKWNQKCVMVYAPAGRKFSVHMDKVAGARINAWGFNPRTGNATLIDEFPNTGTREFTPPDYGEALDWVLVLDEGGRNFPAPGTRR